MAKTLYTDDDYIVDDNYIQIDVEVNWTTGEIFVPKFKSIVVQTNPLEIRQLNLDEFRLTLKDLEDDADGMSYLDTHQHNTTVTVGGVTLARVIEIINSYTVTFEDGQYAINLVGANSNVSDVVNVNQVSVRSANSAGLQDLSTMLASAYQGRVVVNHVTGQPGTSVPLGTFSTPVSNTSDAITIASKLGVDNFLYDTSTEINEDLSAGYSIRGGSPQYKLTANPIANLTGCALRNLTVEGELDGLNVLQGCNILDITNVSGFIEKCAFTGTATFNNSTIIMGSYSNRDGGLYPIFTVLAGNLAMRDFHGSAGLDGITQGDHSIELYGGRTVIENTCVGGTIYVRGQPTEIIDNSGPGCTVFIETNSSQTGITEQDKLDIAQDVWEYVI